MNPFLVATTTSSHEYESVIVYKLHFTWVFVLIFVSIALKYFIGPWLIKNARKLGEELVDKYVVKLTKHIDSFKNDIKELDEKEHNHE
jgi:hypothetical protein